MLGFKLSRIPLENDEIEQTFNNISNNSFKVIFISQVATKPFL